MFIGHFGVGLGLKRAAPAVSLGTLFLCAQFIDLLWPTLLLLGVEHARIAPELKGPPLEFTHYPFSHSLAMVAVWAGAFGAGYYALRRNAAGAVVCALAVLSHWILDLMVHHPDLPLHPGGGARFGLGLWSSLPASLLLECLIFGVGTWLYCRGTRPSDRKRRIGFWVLITLLVGIHLGNVFGAPPPSITAVAWVGQAQWLLVLWAYWVDPPRSPERVRVDAVSRP